MTKSYKEITKTSALLAYNEEGLGRTEKWVDENFIYSCLWFWTNNGECPSTIKYEPYVLD